MKFDMELMTIAGSRVAPLTGAPIFLTPPAHDRVTQPY